MSPNDRFRINTPKASYETIDGETVIINLDNGNYYSLIGVGSDIWRFIENGATVDNIIEVINHQYEGSRADVEDKINKFIAELLEEGLVVNDNRGKKSEGMSEINSLIRTGLSEKRLFLRPRF